MSEAEGGRRVDSVGDEPRKETREVTEVDDKTWFRDLDEAVVEAERCVRCSSCVDACPSDSIGVADDGLPTLVRMCTGCSRCWDFCPRAGLRYEALDGDGEGSEGVEPRYISARATEDAGGQDGGAVTGLIAELLRNGRVDGAVVAREDPERAWRGAPYLATEPEEVLENSGSFYNQTMPLADLDDAVEEAVEDGWIPEDPELAFVGTPCEIEGVTALQRYPWGDSGAARHVSLKVALMCTRNFDYRRLRIKLEAERGLDLQEVEKLDVEAGDFVAEDASGEELLREHVEALDAAALKGCDECADFTGATADVTAGSIGTEEGRTTLVVRTEAGREAVDSAEDVLDVSDDVDVERIRKVEQWNLDNAVEAMPREFDTEGAVGVSLEDHLKAYGDTDREPRPLNRARVHRYEERC